MSFPTTHWSALAKATLHGETQARQALEELCERYWQPVFQFVRLRGFSPEEAQDLTQDFILHIIEKSLFTRADRLLGQFRSFLLGALMRFLADALDRRSALKRGGEMPHISANAFDFVVDAEPALQVGTSSADFDREWALNILEIALKTMAAEFAVSNRAEEFVILKDFLPGSSGRASYEHAASALQISVPAFKSEVHRLRTRFRSLVRAEVSRTVSAPHETEEEMRYLGEVLMQKGNRLLASSET